MVTSGVKLSDIPINLALQLLKILKQFPNIIHSHRDHWIIVSTVGCTKSVCVYDSVYNTLDKGTIDIIFNSHSLTLLNSVTLICGEDAYDMVVKTS